MQVRILSAVLKENKGMKYKVKLIIDSEEEFTGEDEVDGSTPDRFSDIRGLKRFLIISGYNC